MKQVFAYYDPARNYDMFGYPGWCCQTAIRRDDPEQAQECWRRGWMDYDTRMLIGTVGAECEKRAPKVAERLKTLGPCKTPPMPQEEFVAPVEAVA